MRAGAKITKENISGIKDVPRYTCKDAIDKVEARWKMEGKMSPANISLIKQARATFGARPVEDITTEVLDRFVQARIKDGYAVATSNRQIQLPRRGFKLLGAPWPQFELPSEAGNVRESFFTPAQMAKLLAAIPGDLADFTNFCYATGMRKGEARQITWAMVNKNEIRVPAEIVKNRRPHIIPLVGAVREIIARRAAKRTMASACVFTWDGEPILELRETWRNACIKSGCGNMLFHDLRRSAVRDLIDAGVSQAVAMSISGHRRRSARN